MNDQEPKGALLELLWHTREAFSVRANVSENYSSAMIWRLLSMCATELVAHLRTDLPLFIDCKREECAVCEPRRLVAAIAPAPPTHVETESEEPAPSPRGGERATRGLIESETPAPSPHVESEITIPTEKRAVRFAHRHRRGGKPEPA